MFFRSFPKTTLLILGYDLRSYFPDDYMSLCDDRPPYRWVGVGPRRSGTIMHQARCGSNPNLESKNLETHG